MVKIYLALGSNVGDREKNIRKAIDLLSKKVMDIKVASLYETEPVGYTEQDKFINTALEGYTNLSPEELLKFCQYVEKKVGRIYRFKWGPREIDIDILLYGNLKIDKPNLKIPHPLMLERNFVMKPLEELNPNIRDEVLKVLKK
ncbi:MAG: 2-amino-4-hydroxy-6-hydroxymethyldihydropteridine diphosphokinase [Persephonella sp.]|nr:MAG: 2-amino-4-hydroxy-6-hydroxymethyldihydropteridine diphosphokinase [Persephonella sp.]